MMEKTKKEGDEGRPRLRLRVKMSLSGEEGQVFFGPGVLELLRGVRETGSIQRAAKGMGLSYVKALKILRQTDEGFGRAFLSRRKGGNERGRSELTEFGARFLERYEAFCAETGKVLDARFAEVADEVFGGAGEEGT